MASGYPRGQLAEAHDPLRGHEELQSTVDSGTSSALKPFSLIEETGDLFASPPRSVIIHACNCSGSWGAGIALQFKKRYPKAFRQYEAHCKNHSPSDLVGTALLIPPSPKSDPTHYVGCLFTSKGYGRRKDSVDEILEATKTSMMDLLEAIIQDGEVEGIYMCNINSGRFAVPWPRTKEVLEALVFDLEATKHEIRVLSPTKT
jgi:ADP-ribose 1''-phosphate phosphatase